uniref:Claudin n=1 Tax=Electrophorus electricus TaxID=8005 RepID=A0A4W4G8B0_ELEEL
MPSSTMQMLAFILALLGVLGATVATLLPNWKVSADVGSNIMTAISQMQGLWMDCTWYSTGVFSCTFKYSVLALPAYLQTARTTMVLACMTATLGLCLAALGLKCTHWGGSHRSKGHTAIAAGACFVIAGVLCLVPASWFTNEVITTFLDARVPQSSKYEPGGAVYVAFISAGFFLAGGVIFCLSCPRRSHGPLDSGSSHPDKPLRQQPFLIIQKNAWLKYINTHYLRVFYTIYRCLGQNKIWKKCSCRQHRASSSHFPKSQVIGRRTDHLRQ